MPSRGGMAAHIRGGLRIHCRHVIFATGYEVREILPRGIVHLKSTYAVALGAAGRPLLVGRTIADLADRKPLTSMRDRPPITAFSSVAKTTRRWSRKDETSEFRRRAGVSFNASSGSARGSRSNQHLRGRVYLAARRMASRISVPTNVFRGDSSPSGSGAMESRLPKLRLAWLPIW